MALRTLQLMDEINNVLGRMGYYNEESKEYTILTKNLESLSASLVNIQKFEQNKHRDKSINSEVP